MRVGQEYQIVCISAGSRPHPNITWTLGSLATLAPLPAQTQHGVNMSSSRVIVTASRRHHGQRLSCISLNPLFPDYPLTDSILLNVTYPPAVTVEVGGGGSEVVLEGRDIYFNCNVDANPPAYKISWFHQERLLVATPETGMVISGHSLAIQSIIRHQAGPYSCSASNVEGDARSTPINITVNYAPVCVSGSVAGQVYAAGVGQMINVTCGVFASPPIVKFSWVFNNSVKSERLPGDQVILSPGGHSVAQFWVREVDDYGTLQCWAENTIGKMASPCLFTIIPAGLPQPPQECSLHNQTYNSLTVVCTPGFDGGLTQTFTATVYEAVTGLGQVNVTSPLPNFTLRGLTPGLNYLIQVVATNAMGTSTPVVLNAFTYKTAENRMRSKKNEEVSRWDPEEDGLVMADMLMVVVAAAVAVIVVVLVVVVVGRCVVIRRQQQQSTITTTVHHTTNTQQGPAIAACPVTSANTEVEFEMEALVVGGSVLLPPAPRPPKKK